MHTKTIKELSALLQARKISATELATLFLDRIEQSDLNAFLHVDRGLTLAQAAQADDQRIIMGKDAPSLTGIPLAHKDIFVTRGWRTTAGSKMLENYISPFDAAVVERLNKAGAVTLGKLNCDEFAMGSGNETSYFGAVRNPW
ncbi:MAG: amidase, partial [Herbaspirillum sp.]